MFVSQLMRKDAATVLPNDTINRAFQVLYERGHSQLPVLENGKVVGLITEKLLAEVSPSKATSLSVFEINYLLSKTTVKEIMIKNVFTVQESELVEDAALIMYNHDIGFLPVVDADNKLVGILSRLDIFKAFIELMGVNDHGSRIALEVDNNPGVVASISGILLDAGININHISNFHNEANDRVEIIIHIGSDDVSGLLPKLEGMGYKVTNVKRMG